MQLFTQAHVLQRLHGWLRPANERSEVEWRMDLYFVHREEAFRLIRQLIGSECGADDLVVKVFDQMFRAPCCACSDEEVGKRLRAIAVNLVLAGWEAGNSSPLASSVPVRFRAGESHASSAHALYESLATIPPRLRATVILRDIAGVPLDEIAAILRVSEPEALASLVRARQMLLSAFASSPSLARASRSNR